MNAPTTSASAASIAIVASNSSGDNLEQFSSQSQSLDGSWSHFNISGTLPAQTAYFTLRVFSSSSETSYIKNVSLRWASAVPANGTFSGFATVVSNSSSALPTDAASGEYSVSAEVKGNGTIRFGHGPVVSSSLPSVYTWVNSTVNGDNGSLPVSIHGKLDIAGLVASSLLDSSPAGCSISNARMISSYSVSFRANFSRACYVELSEPFSTHWQLADNAGSPIQPVEGFLGNSIFGPLTGNGTVSIFVEDVVSLPILLVLFDGYSAVVLVIILLPILLGSLRRVRGHLRRRKIPGAISPDR